MGFLLADIATTLVVVLLYWMAAVLREALRSLTLFARRVRTRGLAQQTCAAAPGRARRPGR